MQGAVITMGSYQFQIDYAGGGGQDVVLTCIFAPNVWTGAASNFWSNPANWSSGVPQAGTTLTFPQTLFNTQQINDLGSGITFNSIVFNGSGYRIGGNAIGLTGGVTAGFLFGNTFDAAITLVGDQTLDGDVTYNGPISGSGHVKGQGMSQGPRLSGTHPFNGVWTGKLHLLNASLPNASMDLAPNAFPSAQLSGNGSMGGCGAGVQPYAGRIRHAGAAEPGQPRDGAIPGRRRQLQRGDCRIAAGSWRLQPGAGGRRGESRQRKPESHLEPVVRTDPRAGVHAHQEQWRLGRRRAVQRPDARGRDHHGQLPVPDRLCRRRRTGCGADLHLRAERVDWRSEQLLVQSANWSSGVPQAGTTLTFPQTLFNTQQINDLGSGITFNSIVFNGSGYRIGGNAIGLTGGVTAGFLFGNTFDAAITLVGDQTLDGDVTYNGPISGSGHVKGQG
jgi:hypothetical protein